MKVLFNQNMTLHNYATAAANTRSGNSANKKDIAFGAKTDGLSSAVSKAKKMVDSLAEQLGVALKACPGLEFHSLGETIAKTPEAVPVNIQELHKTYSAALAELIDLQRWTK